MKIIFALATTLMLSTHLNAENIEWFDGKKPVSYCVQRKVSSVVETALQMFSSDMKAVTGFTTQPSNKNEARIRIFQLDETSNATKQELRKADVPIDSLARLTDGFHIAVKNGKINIIGTNGRGTAYGILELSRMAGVSPWIWWGDVVPQRKQQLTIDSEYNTTQSASVEYRGIFINDEDWSTRPWSTHTFEKAGAGKIGHKTYKKIFQLLMRLRANAAWGAMHPGTEAFFSDKRNKAVADSCGIVIGSSHCEPLLRNNVAEWNEKERGAFNYITNKESVKRYWAERLQEVKHSTGNMLTIGMRGIHDGSMLGVKTIEEKTTALQQVIDDQQTLITKYLGDTSKQTQVIVPYKEVLQIYERGLRVPDYVTLMWCDDNYGYLTRLSTPEEQKRKGGAGVYYHLSYWGRPHDYLWLTTTQPGLIYNEMNEAYQHGARKIWIANVHDVKAAGYDLELFLDMAWNINSVSHNTINDHYKQWLCQEFGETVGNKIFPAMHEFYRLCGERKPEFMGWNQTELDKRTFDRGISPVRNSELNASAFGNELDRYIERYKEISNVIESAKDNLRPTLNDAYFAAIEYPMLAACNQAIKMLEAQKARQLADGSTPYDMATRDLAIKIASAKSQKAYQEIRKLTERYNTMANGKWSGSMNMSPRDLLVFAAPSLPILLTDKEVEKYAAMATSIKHDIDTDGAIARNACEYSEASNGTRKIEMLGHSMNAMAIEKGGWLSYNFTTDKDTTATLYLALIPTQPNDNGDIRISVSIDDATPQTISLKEAFRSEGWKQNVLRGQALKKMRIKLSAGNHRLMIKALDSHIIMDQWMIDPKPNRKFYILPAKNVL